MSRHVVCDGCRQEADAAKVGALKMPELTISPREGITWYIPSKTYDLCPDCVREFHRRLNAPRPAASAPEAVP